MSEVGVAMRSALVVVALALSAYDERLKLPAIIGTLGLVLFAYTIGVSAGPSYTNCKRPRSGTRRSRGSVRGARGRCR